MTLYITTVIAVAIYDLLFHFALRQNELCYLRQFNTISYNA